MSANHRSGECSEKTAITIALESSKTEKKEKQANKLQQKLVDVRSLISVSRLLVTPKTNPEELQISSKMNRPQMRPSKPSSSCQISSSEHLLLGWKKKKKTNKNKTHTKKGLNQTAS